uniref:KIF-binding protein n=1 Tax=Hirondellea gigas TaxID=1518452 RepID=A0A2P2IAL2_9CRUS
MERRTAWHTTDDSNAGADDVWTLDQFGDQFQKAITLCGISEDPIYDDSDDEESDEEETIDSDHDSDAPCNNDHNSDVLQPDKDKTSNGKRKIEPYKNKYMSRVLLAEMKVALSRQFDMLTPQQQKQGIGEHIQERLLAVSLQLGLIAVSVQEPSTGEEHFSHVIQSLEQRAHHPRCINLLLSALNQMGLLWAERFENAKAKHYLLKSSEHYNKYKEDSSCVAPIAISDLFLKVKECEDHTSGDGLTAGNIMTVADEGETDNANAGQLGHWADFEQLHTYTFYFLAQVCGHLDESADSARYCHATLHRQLADTIAFEPLEWSNNASQLSVYYSSQKDYKMACYLMSASWIMLGNNAPPCNSAKELHTRYQSVKVELEQRIGSYCVKILQDSEYALEAENENPVATANSEEPSHSASSQWEEKKFVGLDPEAVESLEGKLPGCLVKDYEGARVAFLVGLEHLEKVSSYFTLSDHASRHTEAVQSISRLYQGLAAFEPQPDRRSKMHKRRVDLLLNLLNELNPQFYLSVCRQLRYELAETYSNMAQCKEEPQPLDDSSTSSQQGAKVASLMLSSIDHYKLFINSYRATTGELPTRFPDEAERAALVAYFHMGRLWNKIKSANRSQAIVNLTNSINSFKEVVDYATRCPESQGKISEELELCKEMVQLLPLKLAQLRA